MKIVERVRALEATIGSASSDYEVNYEYDDKENVIKEIITGAINVTTEFEYDENDNVIKEIKKYNNKIITRTYIYENDSIKKVIGKVINKPELK